MAFVHTPYDGSRQPFTVGLAPLDPAGWIEPDSHLARDLAEKDRLIATCRDLVFQAEPGTQAAQAEVLSCLLDHVMQRFPDLYRRSGDVVELPSASRRVDAGSADPPLLTASRLVQEDLCLLRRGAHDWRLAAAVVCFPSGWSLAEKIGRPLDAIHEPVPGYEGRMSQLVSRILDKLRVEEPVIRFNWSIHADGKLHHPAAGTISVDRFTGPEDVRRAHIRIERQTLRRLPVSGDVLFTIRTHTDAIADLAADPRGKALATGLRNQLLALSEAQAAYKGLAGGHVALAEELARVAQGA